MTNVEEKADKLLSIRMTPRQRADLEIRSDVEGLAVSTWARDALLMLVAGGLSLSEVEAAVRAVQAQRAAAPPLERTVIRGAGNRLGRKEILDGRCLHPVHIRVRKPFYDECPCGETFRR